MRPAHNNDFVTAAFLALVTTPPVTTRLCDATHDSLTRHNGDITVRRKHIEVDRISAMGGLALVWMAHITTHQRTVHSDGSYDDIRMTAYLYSSDTSAAEALGITASVETPPNTALFTHQHTTVEGATEAPAETEHKLPRF